MHAHHCTRPFMLRIYICQTQLYTHTNTQREMGGWGIIMIMCDIVVLQSVSVHEWGVVFVTLFYVCAFVSSFSTYDPLAMMGLLVAHFIANRLNNSYRTHKITVNTYMLTRWKHKKQQAPHARLFVAARASHSRTQSW